jgi:hypothetical protein
VHNFVANQQGRQLYRLEVDVAVLLRSIVVSTNVHELNAIAITLAPLSQHIHLLTSTRCVSIASTC